MLRQKPEQPIGCIFAADICLMERAYTSIISNMKIQWVQSIPII